MALTGSPDALRELLRSPAPQDAERDAAPRTPADDLFDDKDDA